MAGFTISTISCETAAHVRDTMRAPDYGHPVYREVARGTGPCRVCLQPFSVGNEERLLFTFNPFAGRAQLAQPGPVFIHAAECEPAARDTYPVGLRSLPVVAQAHLVDGTVAPVQPLVAWHEEEMLETMLLSPETAFIHLRHAEAGCFITRVERAGPSSYRG